MDLFIKPLSVVLHNTKKIKGIFILFPEFLFDSLVQNTRPEFKSKHIGPNWGQWLNPNFKDFMTEGMEKEEKDDSDLSDYVRLDRHTSHKVGDVMWIIRCGVLKTDNLLQIRLKIYGVLGVPIYIQHLCYIKANNQWVSDIIADYGDKEWFSINPFDAYYPKVQGAIHHELNLTCTNCKIYLFLLPFISRLNDLNSFYLFPQLPQEYVDRATNDPLFNLITSSFPFNQPELQNIHKSQNEFIQTELNEDDLKEINITSRVFILTFKANTTNCDIRTLYNQTKARLKYAECRITRQGIDLTYQNGTEIKKINVLKNKIKTMVMNLKQNYLFCNHRHGGNIFVGYFGENGDIIMTIKFKQNSLQFNEAITWVQNAVHDIIGDLIPKIDTQGNPVICMDNILNIAIVFDLIGIVDPKKYESIKMTLIKEKERHTVNLIKHYNKGTEISIQILINPPKSLTQLNEFENWATGSALTFSGTNFFSYVVSKFNLSYTQITIKTNKVAPKHVETTKRIISFICKQSLEGFKLYKDNELLGTGLSEKNKQRNSKFLRGLDPVRFDYAGLDTQGKSMKQFAQMCQLGDQPIPITTIAKNSLPPDELKRVTTIQNLSTGEELHLKCPKQKPVLNHLVHNGFPSRTIKGVVYCICMCCCRKREPKDPKRIMKNEICKKTGFFPLHKIDQNKNMVHILKPTINKCTKRLLSLPENLNTIFNSHEVFLYGPELINSQNKKYLNGIYSALGIDKQSFQRAINLYFNEDETRFVKFLNISTFSWDVNEKDLLFACDVFPDNICGFPPNSPLFEHFINTLIELVYNVVVFVLKEKKKYPISFFLRNNNSAFIILIEFTSVYFPLVEKNNTHLHW
jgi:hypothetical protein